MGQQTSKPQRHDKNRTTKGPSQKKKKAGRISVGKKNIIGGARGQVHGKKKEDDTLMDVEANEVEVKRKERIPFEEISVNDETKKKQKMEGEVMALGKIMAQHLGLALAAGLPRREQRMPYG